MACKTLKLTTLKRWTNVQVQINLGVPPYEDVTVHLDKSDLRSQLVELVEVTTNVHVLIPTDILSQLQSLDEKLLRPFKSISCAYPENDEDALLLLSKVPNLSLQLLTDLATSSKSPKVLQAVYDFCNGGLDACRTL